MAIETGGYRPDVHLAVPETRFVQADPNAVNTGILAQFNLATDIEKAKAFKMAFEENQALHNERHNAAREKLLNDAESTIAERTLRPIQTRNTLADIQLASELKPGAATLAHGLQNFNVEQQPTLLDTQGQVNTTENLATPARSVETLNKAETGAAKSEGELGVVDTQNATNRTTAQTAQGAAEFANQTQGMVQETQLAKIVNDFQNADTDIKRAEILANLEVDQRRAAIAALNAQANFNNGIGRQTGATGKDKTMQDLNTLGQREASILKQTVSVDGYTYPLEVYAAKIATGEIPHSAEGDNALLRLKQLRELQDDALKEYSATKAAKELSKTGAANPLTPNNSVKLPPIQGAQPAPAAPAESQGVYNYDTPAQPAVKYDAQGNAWTLDAQGNVVPYKP